VSHRLAFDNPKQCFPRYSVTAGLFVRGRNSRILGPSKTKRSPYIAGSRYSALIEKMDRFVTQAIGWIVRHLGEFDPFKNGQAFDVKNGQRVGELAILLHAYSTLTGRYDSDAAKAMARLLLSIQQKPAFADRVMRSPSEFILFAEVYSSLLSAGHDSESHRRLLQCAIDAGYLNFSERLPHRVMDVASCLARARLRHSLPRMEVLFRRSILSSVPCPMLLNEDGLYFLTHAIMFIFDFGARQTLKLKKSYKAELQAALSALIVAMCQEHHWDLLAELLVCWDCVALPHTNTYKRAWHLLRRMQTADGAVPGPEWASKLLDQVNQRANSASASSFLFDHHYHTTLVSVIAGVLRAKRRKSRAALETQGRRQAVPNLSRRGFSLLRCFDRSPHKIERALLSARDWLISILDNESNASRDRAEVFSGVLMGVWICDSAVSPSARLGVSKFIQQAKILLMEHLKAESAWARTPPLLKLISAALLRQHGTHIPALHGKDGFVRRAANALSCAAGKWGPEEWALLEKRVVLHQMGLLPRPHPVSLTKLWRDYRDFNLGDPNEAVDHLLQLTNAHTLYGLEVLPPRPEYRDVAHRLCELAASRLRHYDLLSGSKLLRAAFGLASNSLLSCTCVDFLVLQQKPDGAFGFLGAEEHRVNTKDQTVSHPDVAVDLYLPISLECAWALAEATGKWSFMRSLC
jgi:hypothetical protein